jgi:hypothetical protein
MAITIKITSNDAWIALSEMLDDIGPSIRIALLQCQQMVAWKLVESRVKTAVSLLSGPRHAAKEDR